MKSKYSRSGFASSFADKGDVARFKACKKRGLTDEECFAVGDNGIGCWGDDTTNENYPYVAVPPDDMVEKFGEGRTTKQAIAAARHAKVYVTIRGETKTCILGDRMPWRKKIKNNAVIDLAPGAQKLFNLSPPFMVNASWKWV